MPVAMQNVCSGMVDQIGYDAAAQELRVKWKGSSRVSVYEGVPQPVAQETMNAWSIGKQINAAIKPAYRHRYAEKGEA